MSSVSELEREHERDTVTPQPGPPNSVDPDAVLATRVPEEESDPDPLGWGGSLSQA